MNHANEIRTLARLGLVSAYHVSRGVEAGNEPEPTFYWRRRVVDGYHIDYVFVPEEWSACVFDLTVGRHEEWTKRYRNEGGSRRRRCSLPGWIRDGSTRPEDESGAGGYRRTNSGTGRAARGPTASEVPNDCTRAGEPRSRDTSPPPLRPPIWF